MFRRTNIDCIMFTYQTSTFSTPLLNSMQQKWNARYSHNVRQNQYFICAYNYMYRFSSVFYTVTKSMRTIHKNMVIHTATHTTPEDLLICGDSLINDKAKICNHHKFYNHYYESFIKSSWSGSISFCLFPFLFTNPNNLEPLQIQNLQLCIKFFFTSVTDQTNCLAIKGFDRTKRMF